MIQKTIEIRKPFVGHDIIDSINQRLLVQMTN